MFNQKVNTPAVNPGERILAECHGIHCSEWSQSAELFNEQSFQCEKFSAKTSRRER